MILLGGGANFLTEFGVCSFSAEDPSDPKRLNTEECEVLLDHCDNFFTSWAYWDSKFYYDDLQINEQLVQVFSRVYPRVTNGIPLSLSYNFTTGRFSFTFELNLNNPGLNTEIFIPDHVYPNGFEVMTNPELTFKFDSFKRVLYVYLKGDISTVYVNYFFVILFKK